ncbi:MAG: PKD domain-containing protein [Bacteroidetes bacterium]|nr:PKD domain-containing protein [Bacteroidota bacterium]
MKKIILLLITIFAAVSIMAQQNYVSVYGHVTDSATGNPVVNYAVNIDIDSATYGFSYHNITYTDVSGFYADSAYLANTNTTGLVTVSLRDCRQELKLANFAFYPGQHTFFQDFAICTGTPPPPCHADYLFGFPQPLEVQFTNISAGSNGPWQWSFDDGTTSTLRDPLHAYALPGLYHVSLTMGDSMSGCFDFESKAIQVGDSTGGGCHAEFTWYTDSTLLPNTVYFNDQSVGGGDSWFWDFGDSTFSSDQNPTHTYAQNGVYHVCLTITKNSPPCQDVICKDVYIGPPPPPPCESWFTHMNNWLTVSFEGHMQMNEPATYDWTFGDGGTGTGKNIDHQFASPGIYNVTLMTISLDSSQCTWISTQQIFVGDSNNINQVYGQVFEGNFPLNFGMVMIFGVDTTQTNPPYFAQSYIDSAGIYVFPYVPVGDYIIWAVPFDSTGGYLPTYYGDVLYWQQATVIHIGQPQNPYNIHLLHCNNMASGTGGINGQVNTTGLKLTMVDKISMLLTDDQGQTIGFRKVDPSGSFDFGDMAYGTYYLKPELPNTSSDLVTVVLSAANPTANVVMTFTGGNILGVSEPVLVESFTSYPNPVKDVLNLNFNMNSSVNAVAEIYSVTGQVSVHKTVTLTKGTNRVQMDVSMLSSGIYLLKITSPDGVKIIQKLVK